MLGQEGRGTSSNIGASLIGGSGMPGYGSWLLKIGRVSRLAEQGVLLYHSGNPTIFLQLILFCRKIEAPSSTLALLIRQPGHIIDTITPCHFVLFHYP